MDVASQTSVIVPAFDEGLSIGQLVVDLREAARWHEILVVDDGSSDDTGAQAAAVGARVTNVDVSARYLEWGRRNLALNGLEPSAARFFRMDAFEFLAYAARHREERFDLVILDPPTFAAGDRRRGVNPWKALDDFPALVQAALRVLAPGGSVFARRTRESWLAMARSRGSSRRHSALRPRGNLSRRGLSTSASPAVWLPCCSRRDV